MVKKMFECKVYLQLCNARILLQHKYSMTESVKMNYWVEVIHHLPEQYGNVKNAEIKIPYPRKLFGFKAVHILRDISFFSSPLQLLHLIVHPASPTAAVFNPLNVSMLIALYELLMYLWDL